MKQTKKFPETMRTQIILNFLIIVMREMHGDGECMRPVKAGKLTKSSHGSRKFPSEIQAFEWHGKDKKVIGEFLEREEEEETNDLFLSFCLFLQQSVDSERGKQKKIKTNRVMLQEFEGLVESPLQSKILTEVGNKKQSSWPGNTKVTDSMFLLSPLDGLLRENVTRLSLRD